MLEKFRDGVKGPMAKVVMGVIMASFVFAGVGSYFVGAGTNNVATVNGEDITIVDFNRSYQQTRNRFGAQFDQFFSTDKAIAEFQNSVVERLITNKLLTQASEDLGLYVGNNVIYNEISNTPDFQVDGKFNADAFRSILNRAQYNQSDYEEALRKDKQLAQFRTLSETEFALKSEVDYQLSLSGETRSGAYLTLDSKPLEAGIDFEGDEARAELEQYYQSHIGDYLVPEKVSVEYLEIDEAALLSEVNPDEDEIVKFYEEHLEDYGSPEERRVSHILVNLAKDATDEEVNIAQKKMAEISLQLTEGKDFAELAKQFSDDKVSSESGGDLDFFGVDVMDPEFEKAAFALEKKGDRSSVVRSQFGLHLIQLTDIHPSSVKSLDEVKDKVIESIKQTQLEILFTEKKDLLTEKAFEYSDSLVEVAEESGLTVKTSELFPQTGGQGIFSNPAVAEAAFSEQVLDNNYNSDVISIGKNHIVVLRLKQQVESFTESFEQVKDKVTLLLKAEKAKQQVADLGYKLVASLNEGQSSDEVLANLPEELKASWQSFENVTRVDAKLPAEIRQKTFVMSKPVNDKVSITGENVDSGFVVIKLVSSQAGDPAKSTEEQRKQVEQQLTRKLSTAEDSALRDWLKENADIVRYPINQG